MLGEQGRGRAATPGEWAGLMVCLEGMPGAISGKSEKSDQLFELFCSCQQQLAQIEADLKSRTAAYNALKVTLENLEKKSQ